MSRGAKFRRFSWIPLLFGAFLVFYSGLFLLDIVPGRPGDSFRFWNGGAQSLFWGGVLDMVGGAPALITVVMMLVQGGFKRSVVGRQWFVLLLFFYALGIAGDLTAGIYAIGAQIGFYTTIADLLTLRNRPELATVG
ncbi:MAG: hypothetical protein M1503_05585 [Thaumarchaeota archaeon]|nr:hypothetical protein [Nitrososphaerota archaeon]MCL5317720.1 hypothetical protein [Nitrososphaerota archaeon]